MPTHKHIDGLCLAATLLSLLLCGVLMNGEALGLRVTSGGMGYETLLFDTARVHTIDIVMEDWEAFLETAQEEEYTLCSVVIDGEAIKNAGLRAKGNTSLSTVSALGSQRYSFKLEFDHYDPSVSYHGLDKLCLNNLIQDNTYMKDYLTYRMMDAFGAAAPLCSYVSLTVNGEDWGLYLAVEAVEESFLRRNYGSDYGELYKPDSLSFGGGRDDDRADPGEGQERPDAPFSDRADAGRAGDGREPRQETQPSEGQLSDRDEGGGEGTAIGGGQPPDRPDIDGGQLPDRGAFGMGSADVKLQYIDDAPDSYSAIFDSAKTDITEADQRRLIASLKKLSAFEDLEEVVNVDAVLRYFVVHNYVVNGDSYTGSMIHNYYLYEEEGRLSMIPWDYNLAFGTFQSGSAASAVNDDIDAVLSDRPMQAWIFSDETYSGRYAALYAELLEQVDISGIVDSAYALIAPYVEKDPTAFCTYEEFQTGVETLKQFCALRSESVRRQLAGSGEAVDADGLDLSAMGTMSMGGGGEHGAPGGFGRPEAFEAPDGFGGPDRAESPRATATPS